MDKGAAVSTLMGEKLELARISQLNLLKFSKSPVVQQVAGVPQDVTKAAYSVYALVSPLWGKCYVVPAGTLD